ncbi:hypothetical protein V8J82_04605 [Gymnodinialimonas sp. 2305UL16-5]
MADRGFRPLPEGTPRHIDLPHNLRFAWAPLIEEGGPMASYGPEM